jgi:hypothetical protein
MVRVAERFSNSRSAGPSDEGCTTGFSAKLKPALPGGAIRRDAHTHRAECPTVRRAVLVVAETYGSGRLEVTHVRMDCRVVALPGRQSRTTGPPPFPSPTCSESSRVSVEVRNSGTFSY